MHLALLLLLLCLGECSRATPQVPSLPEYDIWNDGAMVKDAAVKDIAGIKVEHGFGVKITKDKDNKFDRSFRWSKMKRDEGDEGDFRTSRRGKSLAAFNFFSFSTEYECEAEDGRRSGLCLNPYSCRRREGTSSGYCAHGFGVCCVFTTTCGGEVKNNITYFVSPQFPSISRSLEGCTLAVKRMNGASQLRLDFNHFNMGQPNRLTGACDSDVFTVTGGGGKDFRLCGQNTDQHVYYDLDQSSNRIMINMNLAKRRSLQRFWEIRITQIPFAQRAPAGCMQYHTSSTGFIQTLNYAENGRHLANQDYKACVRQEAGMCSIAYEPCDSRSFRIGPNAALQSPNNVFSNLLGNPPQSAQSGMPPMNVPLTSGVGSMTEELIGSGDGPDAAPQREEVNSDFSVQSPYAQHLEGANGDRPLWRYWGYGNYGYGVSSFGRLRCQDRIVTPCDEDEFLGVNSATPGICDPFHCGSNFCTNLAPGQPCRVETSVTPFAVSVKFGPPAVKNNPEDNIGMCLRYEQLPCAE